jgi:hypothetical protein
MAERKDSMRSTSTRILDDEPGETPVELMDAVDQVAAPSQSEIAELAYSYWEARGGQGGSPWEDWFRAERELRRKREL